MTLTINLPDTALAALLADAQAQGRPAENVAAEHLTVLYSAEDTVEEALAEAFVELEAGLGRPFEEYAAELRAKVRA